MPHMTYVDYSYFIDLIVQTLKKKWLIINKLIMPFMTGKLKVQSLLYLLFLYAF